jgi:hypothetical protein
MAKVKDITTKTTKNLHGYNDGYSGPFCTKKGKPASANSPLIIGI